MNFGYKTLLTLTVSAFGSLFASEQVPAAQPELQKTAEIAVVAPNVEAPKVESKVEQNVADQIKATIPVGEHVVIPDIKDKSQVEILKIIKNAIVGLTGMHAEVLSALANETVDALSQLEKAGIVVVQGNGFSVLTTKSSLEKFSIPAINSLQDYLVVPVSQLGDYNEKLSASER